MSDKGEVMEWVETTEEVIIEECVLPNGNSSAVLQVSEPTETPMQKLLDTVVQGEDAELDDGFYCVECRSLFQEQSSVGLTSPSFVLDSPTSMAVPQRALLTLPHGLMIGRSSIPNTGLGVMNQGPAMTPGMHFGPYEGEVTTREVAVASRFSWEIYKVNDEYDYIDATRETHSNWMRYVNCARNREETNLLAVQYKGSILFHCCRTIQPGDELVWWPSTGLVNRLSEAWSHMWRRKLCPTESDPSIVFQMFLCAHCPLSFTTETYRQRHVEHFHTWPKRGCPSPDTEAAEPLDQDQAPGEDFAPAATTTAAADDTATAAATDPDPLDELDALEAKTCQECGKVFKHMHHLKRHALSVHSNKRPYCCPKCRRSFSQASGLLRHQLVHNKQASGDAPSDQSGHQETETETGTGGSPPDASGGEADGDDDDDDDAAAASQEPPGTEESAVAEHTPGQEGRSPEEAEGAAAEKRNTCVQCDKSFSNARYLDKHQTRVHGNLRPYVCTLCRKTFSQHNDLARHLKSHQAKGKAMYEMSLAEEEESSEASADDILDLDFVAKPSLAAHTPEPPKEPAYQRPQRLGVRSKIFTITKLIAPKRRAPAQKRKTPSSARATPEEAEESDVGGASAQDGHADDGGDAGAHSCIFCKQSYQSDEALKAHACAASETHKCARCGAAFKKVGFLKRHERTAHVCGKSYVCNVCGKAFSKLFNLKQHQKIKSCDKHHCTSEIFSCAYCPFSFTIRSYLRKHVRRHHPEESEWLPGSEKAPEEHGGEGEEEAEAAADGTHVCPECGKKYGTAKKYRGHYCFPQVVLYLCTDCGKGFTNHYSLKQHQRVHTGVRPHSCPHCLKTFVHMGQLNVHLRTHTGEKPYLCTHCGDSFRQSGDLKRHERKHTGVRPHSCPECFKSFSRPQSLRAHLLLHLGQRMFKCDECGKSFSRNYHLRRHQQKMHS